MARTITELMMPTSCVFAPVRSCILDLLRLADDGKHKKNALTRFALPNEKREIGLELFFCCKKKLIRPPT